MIFVVSSVVCSVVVSVLLKLGRRLGIDLGQAVAWNYVATAALTWLLLDPSPARLVAPGAPWPALLALGVLLPTIFVALGASVRHAGIVRSDAAQRLSLVLSLLGAFVLFGQALTTRRGVGLALGLVALPALVWRTSPGARTRGAAAWAYPVLVFMGFGAIDLLFKRVAGAGVPLGTSLVAVFGVALVVSFAAQGVRRARGTTTLTARALVGGLVLGAFNFGNILFYVRAHQAMPRDPALVFAGMNLGVVTLGALVGVLAFRERLNRANVGGLLLAGVAIGLLAQA